MFSTSAQIISINVKTICTVTAGMWQRVQNASQPYGLGLEEKLLPQYFKDLGYSTHIVGKWHLGFFQEAYTPLRRGFDTYFGHWNSKADYYNHTHLSIEKIPGTSEYYMGYDLHEGLNVSESRAAMIYEMDVSIGHMVQALKDKNMLENSIIVFMSDNGGAAAGLPHTFGNNWPFKGGKVMGASLW
ncbi:hypothetical protein B566_EDAN016937 [Ephemera danica]|nr:hypothetical protein B566_EDAN016937 [Ephemera danica]